MVDPYKCVLDTPDGRITCESPTLQGVLNLMHVFRETAAQDLQAAKAAGNMQDALAIAWERYSERVWGVRPCQSPLVRAGLDKLVLLKYLRGTSTEDTAAILKAEHGFSTSKTAIGRLWVKFRECGLDKFRQECMRHA